jgi:hypothetical protein
VNNRPIVHDRPVAHLMTVLSACVLVYAIVTRGGLLFARALERIAKR